MAEGTLEKIIWKGSLGGRMNPGYREIRIWDLEKQMEET